MRPMTLFALLTGLTRILMIVLLVQIRDALGAPRSSFLRSGAEGEHDAFLRNVGAFQGGFVGFGVGLFAVRATKSAKSVAVLSEALTSHLARLASHCFGGFCFALHTFNNTAYGSCLSTQISIRIAGSFRFTLMELWVKMDPVASETSQKPRAVLDQRSRSDWVFDG